MLQPNQREILFVNHQIVNNVSRVRDVTPKALETNKELRKAVRGARMNQRSGSKKERETEISRTKIKRKVTSRYKEDKINER